MADTTVFAGFTPADALSPFDGGVFFTGSSIGTIVLRSGGMSNSVIASRSIGTFTVAAVTTDGLIVGAMGPGRRPARPGEVVALFATGLGASNPVWQAGEIPGGPAPVANVTVRLGTSVLPMSDILYAGLAPGAVSGLYQVNVRIPMGTAAGVTPIRVSVGSVISPDGTTIMIGQ